MGDKFKLASKAEEGFVIMARAIFSMTGILYLYPFLSFILINPSRFLARLFQSDGAVLISCILPIDMGGYHISSEVSKDETAKVIGGVLLSSTLGASIGFTYPVAFGILKKEYRDEFIKGSLIGIICIPIGILLTSIFYGFDILKVFRLILFVIIVVIILTIGIAKEWSILIALMKILGKAMSTLNLIGLVFLGFHILTGSAILPYKTALDESIKLPLKMAILIAGSYVFFSIVYTIFIKCCGLVKKRLTLNQQGIEGMMILLTNCVPTLYLYDKMDSKSRIINAALCITTASVVGPQLGFLGAVAPSYVSIFLFNKLISSLLAIGGAILYLRSKGK
jgi:ethanolamine transporter